MNPAPSDTAVAEINRLYEEARQHACASRDALHAALAAAWRAGQLLVREKQRVRGDMGAGAWLLWLETRFHGSARTAQRYMKLARSVVEVDSLHGLSLRQAYARLGIATEPKPRGQGPLRHRLPAHVVYANRLVRALQRRPGQTGDEQREAYRRDLRALYEKLRLWFEPTPNFGPLRRSD